MALQIAKRPNQCKRKIMILLPSFRRLIHPGAGHVWHDLPVGAKKFVEFAPTRLDVALGTTENGSQRDHSMPLLRPEL
jgi:hypothetical protein